MAEISKKEKDIFLEEVDKKEKEMKWAISYLLKLKDELNQFTEGKGDLMEPEKLAQLNRALSGISNLQIIQL